MQTPNTRLTQQYLVFFSERLQYLVFQNINKHIRKISIQYMC